MNEVNKNQMDELLAKVPTDGGAIGNTVLMRQLGWDRETYYRVRNELITQGLLAPGRGYGGSVHRVVTPPEAPPEAEVEGIYSEAQLYGAAAKVIASDWAKDFRVDQVVVEITARQGRRETGGTWSRPDIVAASVSGYLYVPGRHLDVTTFEVKPYTWIDVTSVYEALAHLRAATRAFVLQHLPKDRQDQSAQAIDDLCEEASRHGIGVIVAEDIADYDTWDFRVEAVRREPDPQRLNDFIAAQLTYEAKNKLAMWCR